ncbi:hypothetical protein TNCV_4675631 [Trichonephila clavipes]|nr:hypothetical protein TNCV_4675631 [Trichonephila clavipes]
MVNKKSDKSVKPWKTLATGGSIRRHLKRAEAVAHFLLTTRDNFMGVNLHCLGLPALQPYVVVGGGYPLDVGELIPGLKDLVTQVVQNSSSVQPSNASSKHPNKKDKKGWEGRN